MAKRLPAAKTKTRKIDNANWLPSSKPPSRSPPKGIIEKAVAKRKGKA